MSIAHCLFATCCACHHRPATEPNYSGTSHYAGEQGHGATTGGGLDQNVATGPAGGGLGLNAGSAGTGYEYSGSQRTGGVTDAIGGTTRTVNSTTGEVHVAIRMRAALLSLVDGGQLFASSLVCLQRDLANELLMMPLPLCRMQIIDSQTFTKTEVRAAPELHAA